MNPKLLFVVNTDWFFISHRLPIARSAIKEGYEVHIAVGITTSANRVSLEQNGLIVHPLELSRSSLSVSSTIITLRQIWSIYKSVYPDIVHLVTIKPVILGGILARIVGVPCLVVAFSGLGFVFVAHGFRATVRRHLVGLLYAFVLGHNNLKAIFQNPDDKAILSRIVQLSESKVAMIRGSGVDLTEYVYSPLQEGIPVVLFAARLLVDKGVRQFVEAARQIKQQRVLARFVFAGKIDPGNPLSLTECELAQWVREGVVEHWGERADMPHVLTLAYLVVLPSYYGEGLPKVLIEAAACGRAVVTTDHPGCRDAIEQGVTGVLVPVRDANALAVAIKKLLDDPVSCKAMGRAGRAMAEQVFDVKSVVAKHIEIYEELLSTSK